MRYFFIEPSEGTVRSIKRTTFAYFLFGAIWILVCYGIQFALLFFYPALLQNTLFSLVFSSAVLYGIAFPFLCLFLRKTKAAPPEKRKIPLWQFSVIIPVLYTLSISGNLLGQALSAVLNMFPFIQSENRLTQVILSNDVLLVTFILTVLVAPIMEELVFRKMLISRLLPLGEGFAILLSALFFGLFHGNFYQFFYAFWLGLLAGFLFAKTGKVIYTIALHMTLNFFSGFLPTLLLRNLGIYDESGAVSEPLSVKDLVSVWHLLQYEILLFAIVLAGAVLLFVCFKRVRAARTPSAFSRGVQFCRGFLCAGTVCFLIFWMLVFIFRILDFDYIFRGIL